MTSTSLQNSSIPLSFKIPAADQDVDDLTLGKMLTETYRGQVDYFVQRSVSISQLSSSVKSDRSRQPDECNSSNAQIKTPEEQRQTINAEYREKISHHELQAAHAEEERRLLQEQLWRQKLHFVKLINKVPQNWRNHGNSRVLPSILLREETSSKIKTLLWDYQAKYKNYK